MGKGLSPGKRTLDLGATTSWMAGKKHTPEAISQMSASHKGRVAWNKGLSGIPGHPQTPETRRKVSEARKGMKFSEEHKANLSAALVGRVAWNKGLKGSQVAWNKGLTLSKEEFPDYGRRNGDKP